VSDSHYDSVYFEIGIRILLANCFLLFNFCLLFFIFEGCILLRLLVIIFGGVVNRNSIFVNVFITISYLLHGSVPTGHLQVEYILVNSQELFVLERIRCYF
jgi:hypothetical protein